MTKVHMCMDVFINGINFNCIMTTYCYEPHFTTTPLTNKLKELRKAKFNFIRLEYDKRFDHYVICFRLDVMI